MKIAVWGNELTAWVTASALAANGNDVNFVSHSKINDPITLMGSSIRNEPGLRDPESLWCRCHRQITGLAGSA